VFAGKTQIPVPHGQLEAIYRPSRDDAERVALLLHPHPLYGGTMHNPVVFHCAKALAEAGAETLRINFRGVGESTGTWDEGRGELEDAQAALDFLLAAQPKARDVIVLGYSFGSGMGLRLGCRDDRVRRLIAVATPVGLVDLGFLGRCTKPKLFVHGELDELAPLEPLRSALADRVAPPADLRVIDGADHFFGTGHAELADAVRSWVGSPL